MPRTLSYADAVRLLGATESKAVTWLDRALGASMLATAPGVEEVLGWFDAKSDLVKHGHDLVNGLGERLHGLRRFDRTQRLEAAHAVIVTVAYFECFREAIPDVRPKDLDQGESRRLGQTVRALLRRSVPLPTPEVPYEQHLGEVRGYYHSQSTALGDLLPALAIWDEWNETEQDRRISLLFKEIPGRAVRRYEELFRQLSLDCPELACWTGLIEHQATRLALRTGLAELGRRLEEIAGTRRVEAVQAALSAAYRARLRKPLLLGGDLPAHLHIPALAEGYVDPLFRVRVVRDDSLAQEEFWAEEPVRGDLDDFLTGYLTNPVAVRTPLLVLGYPGSGKSLLTTVLAARLPAADFLPVRVVLRDTAAESDVQTQIEQAVRAATGQTVSWPELAAAGDALPVVLLDGFDELLQATGISQSNYLENVQRFQEREADLGRPVAVLVTTRTTVADRARIPEDSTAIRLEPFDDQRIAAWLGTWNESNAGPGFTALPVETALQQRELAVQPLLLLMLALYHADSGALGEAADLGRGELYERLLLRFARREVVKTQDSLPEKEIHRATEEELWRLAVVAFGMFNRGSQWLAEPDLQNDLLALSQPVEKSTVDKGAAALSEAELIFGRFFFVHRAEARHSGTLLRTYEFLHATFGEYLVARHTWRVLRGLAQQETPDDDLLHALLSHSALCARRPVLDFLQELATQLPTAARRDLARLISRLFRAADQERQPRRHCGYSPRATTVPARLARYRVNLALLAVVAAELLDIEDLGLRTTPDWTREAMFWQSQLDHTEWQGLLAVLHPHQQPLKRHLAIRADGEPIPEVDPSRMMPPHPDQALIGYRRNYSADILDRNRFLLHEQVLVHAAEPLLRRYGHLINAFTNDPSQHSLAHRLVNLWTITAAQTEERPVAYRSVLKVLERLDENVWPSQHESLLLALLERLAGDVEADPELVQEILFRAERLGAADGATAAIFQRCKDIVPELPEEG